MLDNRLYVLIPGKVSSYSFILIFILYNYFCSLLFVIKDVIKNVIIKKLLKMLLKQHYLNVAFELEYIFWGGELVYFVTLF